jgi:anti-sigma B factor antagonist
MPEKRQSIRIHTRRHGSWHVIELHGELDLHSSPALRQTFLELLHERPPRLVVDLTAVEYMDSSGLGTLVDFKRRVDAARTQLVLAGVQARVRNLLQITQLERFFRIVESLAEVEEP